MWCNEIVDRISNHCYHEIHISRTSGWRFPPFQDTWTCIRVRWNNYVIIVNQRNNFVLGNIRIVIMINLIHGGQHMIDSTYYVFLRVLSKNKMYSLRGRHFNLICLPHHHTKQNVTFQSHLSSTPSYKTKCYILCLEGT